MASNKLSDDYNRTSEEFALLEMELENSTQKLAIAKKMLEEADAKLKLLEEKKLTVEELKRKEARLNANLSNMTSTLASLTQRMEGKKSILENLRRRQNSLDLQMKGCLGKLAQAGLPADRLRQSWRFA